MLAIFGFYFFFLPRQRPVKNDSMMTLIDTGKGQLIRSLVLQGGKVVSRSIALPKSSRKPNKPCLISARVVTICLCVGQWNDSEIFLAAQATETSGEVVSCLEDPTCSLNSLESCIERQVKPFEVRSGRVLFGSAFQWFSWRWSHDLERSCLTPENAALFCRKAVEAFKILNMVSWPMATAA